MTPPDSRAPVGPVQAGRMMQVGTDAGPDMSSPDLSMRVSTV
jgi:hypothetical protein